MFELDIQIPTAFHTFTKANAKDLGTGARGLKKEFNCFKILKGLKKEFCYNGTIKNVSTFLVQAGIVKKESIKVHGF
uniref:SUI1 domain-containing protein n=1 Tax=Nelumbo nucifera TaxID=4432 RepID=A0A822YUK8_NELNU|nr:TPA_asm: hypothetical protein HUJ06_008415 [Nelumbo nucifera]